MTDGQKGQKGFQVLLRRSVVERSVAWLGHSRRLSEDYERTTKSTETLLWIAAFVLLNHLAGKA